MRYFKRRFRKVSRKRDITSRSLSCYRYQHNRNEEIYSTQLTISSDAGRVHVKAHRNVKGAPRDNDEVRIVATV